MHEKPESPSPDRDSRLLRDARLAFFQLVFTQTSEQPIESHHPELGAIRTRCIEVRHVDLMEAHRLVAEASEVIPLKSPGILQVETRLANSIVSWILGVPCPVLARSLSRIERGVLEYFLTTVLGDLGLSQGLLGNDRDPLAFLASTGNFLFRIQVELSHAAGMVHCFLPLHAVLHAWRTKQLPALFAGSKVPWAIELARTALGSTDAEAVEVGDTVVLDGIPPLAADSAWPVTVRIGEVEVAALLHPNGDLQLASLPRSDESQARKTDWGDQKAPNLATEKPLELIFEYEFQPCISEILWSFLEGQTISVGSKRNSRVQVRANHRVPTWGELDAVDECLAVRIMR